MNDIIENQSVYESLDQKQTDYTSSDVEYAGFWLRFWAYLIDLLVIFSLSGIILSPLKLIGNLMSLSLVGDWTVKVILAGAIYYLYFIILTYFIGQTVGKLIMNVKVVNETLTKPSLTDVVFREFVVRFSYNTLAIMKLAYLVVAFSPTKQGLHDLVANTVVIKLKD